MNTVYIDGSPVALYGYCTDGNTFVVEDDPMTNNQAEWMALYYTILSLPVGWKGTVYSDSKLIVNQFNEEWRTKDPILKKIKIEAKKKAKNKHLNLDVKWVSRDANEFGVFLDKLRGQRKRSNFKSLHELLGKNL